MDTVLPLQIFRDARTISTSTSSPGRAPETSPTPSLVLTMPSPVGASFSTVARIVMAGRPRRTEEGQAGQAARSAHGAPAHCPRRLLGRVVVQPDAGASELRGHSGLDPGLVGGRERFEE